MLHTFNWIDYTIIGIVVLSALISLMRGFIREAISLATWIVAFWVALTFTTGLTPYLQKYIHTDAVRYAIVFFALFVATLIAGGLVNFLITRLAEKTGLSGTDRLFGAVFGAARGLMLVAILLLIVQMTTLPGNDSWKQSILIPRLAPLEMWLAQYIPKDIQQKFSELGASVNDASKPQNINSLQKVTGDSAMLNQVKEGV